MPILPKSPINVPEKNFDRLGVSSINIMCPLKSLLVPEMEDASASIFFVPYNSETGEKHMGGVFSMSIPSIVARILENPNGKLAIAYQAILEAVQEEYAAQNPSL